MFEDFINEFNEDTKKYTDSGKQIIEILSSLGKIKHIKTNTTYANHIRLITKDLFTDSVKISERLYFILNKLKEIPKCDNPNCNNKVNFSNFRLGYRTYCSPKCNSSDPKMIKKIKEINLKKYGTEFPIKLKEIQEKSKKTNMERYGVDVSSKNKEVQEKAKQTNLRKYGTEHSTQNKGVQEKAKQTNLRKYGAEYTFQSELVKDKIKNTLLEKYGVDAPLKNKEIMEKFKQTNLEKYGVEYSLQNNDVKRKAIETNLEKYGKEYANQSIEVKTKIKKTNMERYGIECGLYNNEIREKTKNTLLEKYGVDSPLKNKEIKDKLRRTNLEKYGSEYYLGSTERKTKLRDYNYSKVTSLERLQDKVIPLFDASEYVGIESKYKWECKQCNNIFEDNLYNFKIPRCPVCYPATPFHSKGELEVLDFVRQHFPNASSDKTILYPQEIDIFIPEKNIGIEYNGLYWHGEISGNKDKLYHADKTDQARSKNIKLLHFFEDEWFNKQDIVKSIIAINLGIIKNKIHARKCEIKEVRNSDAKKFLDEVHLQGSINSKYNIGLFYNNELVSLLTFGKPRYNKKYEYEILRFCNKLNTVVNGSFSKLLKYFIKKYNPKNIITYSDLRYGTGKVYTNNNFKQISKTKPNYYYIDSSNTTRHSRIKFQKHKLKNILTTYDPNLTEWKNMQLNNFDRIWDCGQYSFEWSN